VKRSKLINGTKSLALNLLDGERADYKNEMASDSLEKFVFPIMKRIDKRVRGREESELFDGLVNGLS